MKKTILLSLEILAFSAVSKGQIRVQAFNYRPSGDFGMAMKPACPSRRQTEA
jgi:hypothetical protein